jgi:hypothetical protein
MLRASRLLLSGLALFVGCAKSPATTVDDTFDSKQACSALAKALDAWRAGKADSLTRGKPPIRFVDDDWTTGHQLLRYEFKEHEEEIQPYRNVAVTLSLRDKRGKTIERAATYQVVLDPHIAVLRGD